MVESLDIVKKHVLGKRIHQIRAVNYEDMSKQPNFMKDLVQISLPIFCIHGNHDCIKTIGPESKSILELGQIIELMNYFGKHVYDRDHLHLKPICITKTRASDGVKIGVALYGIGNMNDKQLRVLLEKKKFTIFPPEDEGEVIYTKIMVLHQNRFKGRDKGGPSHSNCITEDILPDGIDLFLWGHEHDCNKTF